jgi:predicted amidophosphoribosyltransferase
VRGRLRCDVDLTGLRIAIIDDGDDDGASLSELAAALRAAGAAGVENWIVARTLPPAH